MTDPLLRWVYPDRMLQADLADAERLRSGGAAPGYQVLVVVDRDGPAPAVNLAAELAGPGGGVLVSRLLPTMMPRPAIPAWRESSVGWRRPWTS